MHICPIRYSQLWLKGHPVKYLLWQVVPSHPIKHKKGCPISNSRLYLMGHKVVLRSCTPLKYSSITKDLELFTSPKKNLSSHQVQSTVTEGTYWFWQALAGWPICHSWLYLMGHKVLHRWCHPLWYSVAVNIKLPLRYRNRCLLKKWHFLDIVCLVYLVTITTGLSYSNISFLKKWHYLDPVCSVHAVNIKTGLNYSDDRSHLKKWHFQDLVCWVHVVTIKTGL